METIQLDEAASVTLDGAGNGTVKLGPTKAGQAWQVTTAAFSVATNAAEPVGKLYLNTVGPGSLIAGTYSGSNDSCGPEVRLFRGQSLVATWEGGDPGARATLSLNGQIELT